MWTVIHTKKSNYFGVGSDNLLTFRSSVYYCVFLKCSYEVFNSKVDIYF